MASTTEQLMRLLSQQPKGENGDDSLNNPELEELFGSLSKGLEKGSVESALPVSAGEPLTLEALAASLGQPLTLGEASATPPVREATLTCPKCRSSNPAGTRFCGMCGEGLTVESPKISGNGAKPVLPEPPQLAQIGAKSGASLAFKTSMLVTLILLLSGVVYYEQLWRLPAVAAVVSDLRGAWTSPASATKPVAETAPAPSPTKAPETARRETPVVVKTPVTVVKASKAAPPTTVTRNLPEPAPLASGSLPQEIPLPALPPPIPPAPVAQSPPVEKAFAPAAPAAPEPKPARISQVSPGVLAFKVNPQYPPAARSARVQGSVVMHALIDTDGTIQQLRVISGNPLLVNAAMEAVKKWRYKPFVLDGRPVEVETNITVNFRGE